ncbi:MAG: hypothetical protein ACI81V_000583 [Lentimonas sp.]|jgi:hypothetical protein
MANSHSLCAAFTPTPYRIDYSDRILDADLEVWPLTIVHPEASINLSAAHTLGHKVLAYVSIVEVAQDASYKKAVQAAGLQPITINQVWGSSVMSVESPEWIDFVIEKLVRPLRNQGYDGLFLDTADSMEFLIDADGKNRVQVESAMLDLIHRIRAEFPTGKIILNRALPLLAQLKGTIDAVMVESLFESYDFSEKHYQSTPAQDTTYLLDKLHSAVALGIEVFALDYVSPDRPQLAERTAKRIESEGFNALIGRPELMGTSLAPIRHIPRKIQVIYGTVSDASFLEYPSDTISFSIWQSSLEWLGYELIYHSLPNEGFPSLPASADYAGVMIDGDLKIPTDQADAFLNYIEALLELKIKLVFTGSFPEIPENLKARLRQILGLSGSLQSFALNGPPELELAYPDRFGFEAPPVARISYFWDAQAPSGADIWLAAKSQDAEGNPIRMDAVYTCDWGGCLLEPYDFIVDDLKQNLLNFDPILLGAALFGANNYPVPDITTSHGERIFYSHVDGDALYAESATELGKYSGEVIRDRILKKYALPSTVSVITAEVRGLVKNTREHAPGDFVQLARSIFALENVEVASHTYSHPFYWHESDLNANKYSAQSLDVGTDYTTNLINFKEEIVDSVAYINATLVPDGKQCELLLWSGNCRPPPMALAVAEAAQILTMNGGDTTISSIRPFRAYISPKALQWRGQTQIFAANQNENVYNNSFGDGLYAGYSNVISTFELTNVPVRFKPVNVYYHFYSANRPDAFRALEQVFEWVIQQSLFPMTASQYIRAVDASTDARIYRTSDGFSLQAETALRTWRFPAAMGYPDLANSSGVIGFNDHAGQRYIATDGRPVVSLKLQSTPPQTPYLIKSTLPFSLEDSSSGCILDFEGWAPGHIELANAQSLHPIRVLRGAIDKTEALPGGGIRLSLSPGVRLQLANQIGSSRR